MLTACLDYIARTNLFNFILFAGIITFLFFKLDVKGRLESGREEIYEHIEDSKSTKEEAEANLKTVEEKIAHIEDEVEEIIRNSEDNANLVGEKIISDANKSVENIKTNSLRLVENKTELVKNDIIRRVSLASVEIAKNQIINELNNNFDLHNKLIDESIETLNGVDL